MSLSMAVSNRVARVVERRTTRRSFVGRSAVVGSALAAVGTDYVLRPGTAYAAICSCPTRGGSAAVRRACNCGDLCCDGYTEFCCHIYGQNACPPDTILAGWWKVDNSTYCDGSARYYMDCNKSAPQCSCGTGGVCRGSDTVCQCRSCSNRADGCTTFRYGNCNNDVACVGPIVCRVVTCTEPWEIDPGCSTVPRTDPATAFHHRACLIPEVEATPEALAWSWAIHADYLRREPTESELQALARRLVESPNRVALSRSFSRSDTYIGEFVTELYDEILGRAPDAEGLAAWTQLIRDGATPAWVAAWMYGSQELYDRSGSTVAYVTRLYREILDREPDAGGLTYWVNRIDSAADASEDRLSIAAAFYASPESRRRRVERLYERFLGRSAEEGGLLYWADILQDGDDLALATYLSGSDEYYQRAQVRFA